MKRSAQNRAQARSRAAPAHQRRSTVVIALGLLLLATIVLSPRLFRRETVNPSARYGKVTGAKAVKGKKKQHARSKSPRVHHAVKFVPGKPNWATTSGPTRVFDFNSGSTCTVPPNTWMRIQRVSQRTVAVILQPPLLGLEGQCRQGVVARHVVKLRK